MYFKEINGPAKKIPNLWSRPAGPIIHSEAPGLAMVNTLVKLGYFQKLNISADALGDKGIF